jgi:N-acyl-L-homoserine lactone synthetase
MVCKRMIDEAFIPVTRRKRVFARKFENPLAISAPNAVESSRFYSISRLKRTFWISHEITIVGWALKPT